MTRPDKDEGTSPPSVWRWGLAVACGLVLLGSLVGLEFWRTAAVRGALRSFTQLIAAANRGDKEAAARLCSPRYLSQNPIVLAGEGGIAGLPRMIHKNYNAWRQGPNVWICPTNRTGPVYQFVPGTGQPPWLFDGLIGELLPGHRFIPVDPTEPDPS